MRLLNTLTHSFTHSDIQNLADAINKTHIGNTRYFRMPDNVTWIHICVDVTK